MDFSARLLGLMMYVQDYDEVLPPMYTTDQFRRELLPYVKLPYEFFCPVTGYAYLPNAALSYQSLSSFASPSTTVVMQDQKPHKDGSFTYGFLDGHVIQK